MHREGVNRQERNRKNYFREVDELLAECAADRLKRKKAEKGTKTSEQIRAEVHQQIEETDQLLTKYTTEELKEEDPPIH